VMIPETHFRERIEDMGGQLSDLRQQRARLAGLGRSIREQERSLSLLEQAGRGAEADVQIAAAAQEDLLQREARLARQREEESGAVGIRLKPYDLTFTADDPLEPLLEELEGRSKRFIEQTEREAESQRRLRELAASIEQLERQQAERLTERQAKEQALRIEEVGLDRSRREREELFGQRDPQTERTQWSETLGRLRRETADVRAQHQEHRLRLTSVEADRRQRHHQRTQTDQRRQTLLRELQEGLAAAGFHDLDQLADAILSAEEAAALELSAAALGRRGAELDRSRRDVEHALARERAREFPEQDRNEAESRWQQAESAFQAAQRDIGSLQRQLEENDRRGRDAAELLAAVERQQQEYDRWESLRELIGSHDGSAFRKFAQSLTLQQLVQRANRHLSRLQGGRYRLQKQRDADLEIEIVDTYQADYVRSVSTLSGGETFLASLALALGLADMAGRHTRIQSLFIDEGFGALDENALELAITTLESLQAEGATIGIISHLRELKERISTQIQVVRRSDGFSEVRLTA
jgi:exonuclease SbcC